MADENVGVEELDFRPVFDFERDISETYGRPGTPAREEYEGLKRRRGDLAAFASDLKSRLVRARAGLAAVSSRSTVPAVSALIVEEMALTRIAAAVVAERDGINAATVFLRERCSVQVQCPDPYAEARARAEKRYRENL